MMNLDLSKTVDYTMLTVLKKLSTWDIFQPSFYRPRTSESGRLRDFAHEHTVNVELRTPSGLYIVL